MGGLSTFTASQLHPQSPTPRVDSKSALTLHPHPPINSPVVYTTDRCNAVVLVLFLLSVPSLWLILRGDLYCLAFRFVLVFFCPFSIVINSLGVERAGLCSFRALVCFARDGFVSLSF